jgi:NAD(P)-dependent dehydrogenase (short-subunit alcohol dehydrogenase family)
LASCLVGRTAIVFGGGHAGEGPHGVHGIGFACAATFAGEGANVVVADRGGAAARHASEAINERGGRSIRVVADLLAPLLVSPLGVLPRVMAVLIFQRRIVAGRTAGGVN